MTVLFALAEHTPGVLDIARLLLSIQRQATPAAVCDKMPWCLEFSGFRVKAPFQWFSRNVFYSSSTCLFACPYILLFVLGARGHLSFIQDLAKYNLVMLIGLF